MLCPVCKETQLVMAERQNIEIDYCPQCRGVWLDRGELDKIIERSEREAIAAVPAQSAPNMPPQAPAANPSQSRYGESNFGHGGGHYDSNQHGGHHGSGRGGFLKRLFD